MQNVMPAVYEAYLKIKLSQNVKCAYMPAAITKLLDTVLSTDTILAEYHEKNCYKGYVFDSGYPVEKDGVYKKNREYVVTVRTIHKELLDVFLVKSTSCKTDLIRVIQTGLKVLPFQKISRLYSITPTILKDEKGYWRSWMSEKDFEKRIFENLVKKWNYFTGKKMDENFTFIEDFSILSGCAVKIPYKNISLLGDKVEFSVADNERAQTLARIAIGAGILENNARGNGFMNYKV